MTHWGMCPFNREPIFCIAEETVKENQESEEVD